MSAPSLAPYILKRPWLLKIFMPVAQWYANTAGYRRVGLLADDLIEEESETVQKALGRLTAKQKYDRIYRIRRAIQADITHKDLPRAQWTKPEDDVPYLTPLIKEIEAANKEKADLDNIEVLKTH